jgi:hypothetical protein
MSKETQYEVFGNALRITQHDGSVDSRFGKTVSQIEARRVEPSDGEQIQISLKVMTTKTGKRWLTQYGSLNLTPEQIQPLITALTKLQPKYDPRDGHIKFSEEQKKWAEFYGLVPHPAGYTAAYVPKPVERAASEQE